MFIPVEVDTSTTECTPHAVEEALKILEGRWKMVIIHNLFGTPVMRLSELQRAIPGISQKMLIQQLRALEMESIVMRRIFAEVPPRVEYGLTESGNALQPALSALRKWAQERHKFEPGDSLSK